MTAIKEQVVLITYSNPTPLALALCVSDAVLAKHIPMVLHSIGAAARRTAAMAFF